MERRRAEAYRQDDELVYIVCPFCSGRVVDPLSRYGGPQFVHHQRSNKKHHCDQRMIVIVDPMLANHAAEPVQEGVRAEVRLRELIRSEEHLRRMLAGVLVHKAGS